MTNQQAISNYNKLGFLAPILIEIIDQLEETNQYKKELKFHLNRAWHEAEKVVTTHFNAYDRHGEIEQVDGVEIHSFDIYNITSKAYEDLFKIFTEKKPNEIASIVQLLKIAEEKGIDYTQIDIPFQPVLR